MSARDTRMPFGVRRIQVIQPSAQFVRLSDLRKRRGSEQVAAVCYRVRKASIEFLLVRTRGSRWTFPKGGVMAGLTSAQAAALEAYEEAGVHGRMEEEAFARYLRTRRAGRRDRIEIDVAVSAHLCEVLRLEPPRESKRNPRWFSIEKTRQRLREERSSEHAEELVRVLDRAVTRIQRQYQPARLLEGRKVLFIDMKKLKGEQ
jgi:8-oxo-dGTP pyrophosphatase MutT (NUDIX family)